MFLANPRVTSVGLNFPHIGLFLFSPGVDNGLVFFFGNVMTVGSCIGGSRGGASDAHVILGRPCADIYTLSQ